MLELAFKQRMVGAIFILSLGVILIPVLFDSPHLDSKTEIAKPKTPQMPDVASVNQINYVFNDLESNFAKADEAPMVDVVPAPKVVQAEHPEPILAVASPEPMPSSAAVVHPISAPPAPAEATDDNDSLDLEPSKPTVIPSPAVRTVVASHVKSEPIIEKWTIQLGAFSSRQNAGVLLKKLSHQGFESYLKDDKSRKLVRVFVAPGVNHNNAQLLLSRLDKELGIKGLIVKFED